MTKKVICDKKDAKHRNVGVGNGWVNGNSLIFKGADIHMHYFKKVDFVLLPKTQIVY